VAPANKLRLCATGFASAVGIRKVKEIHTATHPARKLRPTRLPLTGRFLL
jgi:hypothetical protein